MTCRVVLVRVGLVTTALSAILGALLLASPAARADFGPCPTFQSQPTTCETLTVPLDRSGNVPGQVHLFVERRAATSQPSQGALVVLAGGPGQAASPLIDTLQQALAPALANRDLIVYDVRGTGASDPLNCPGLAAAMSEAAQDAAAEDCANSLGPSRAFYTSRDNTDDLDAIRQSLGLDKISLYGVSYGTYTAITYARRYPDHVQSIALDSVVSPNGRDPFDRTTYAAFPRVLRSICAGGECRGITHNPVADLSTLVSRVRRKPLRTAFFDPNGKKTTGTVEETDVKSLLEGADFDPTARAEIPSSLVSARNGDGAPLARVLIRELSTSGARAQLGTQQVSDNTALFFATSCEEIGFPWSRTAPLSDRPGALNSALAGLPAGTFAPFVARTEAESGTSRPCLRWPDGSPDSPVVTGPVPNVPALLLEGEQDTRTPLADAQAAAALFPQSTLVTVPDTGHSVLGTDVTACSSQAIQRFYGGAPVSQCAAGRPPFAPTPVAPTSIAGLRAVRGVAGKRGQTITAVAGTLTDSVRQAAGRVITGGPIAFGGLRGGRLRGSLVGSVLALRLTNVVYVPGVTVSGTVTINLRSAARSAKLRVSGSKGSRGSLTFSRGLFSGTLDGRRVKQRGRATSAALTTRPLSLGTLLKLRRAAALQRITQR
jgi:pimeloyl-ACP methyl ester carboxylesterase